MILVITGGRDYIPIRACLDQFIELIDSLSITELHHGARGYVDIGVSSIIGYIRPNIKIIPWPVDQLLDGPWPAAGCRRNGRMLRESNCEIVIGFNGGNGTADCIRQASLMYKVVLTWSDKEQRFL